MARKIFLEEQDIRTIYADLKKRRNIGASIEYKHDFVKDDRKAEIIFSPEAWIKMFALVDGFSTEVQWHGLVSRSTENRFIIEDILVFSHTATGATVTSDAEEYSAWLNDVTDDDFNKLKMHGHSHVNMHVSPSPVDMDYRQNVVNNFATVPAEGEDQFYIFLIFNKRREFSGQIFDIKNNALYETKEISIDVVADGDYISDFMYEARKVVKDPPTPLTTHYNGYQGGQGYKGTTTQPPAVKPQEKAADNAKPISIPAKQQGTGVGTSIDTKNEKTYPDMPISSFFDKDWEEEVYGKGVSNK